MHLSLIRTIYLKDMRDAIRDARVLVAVIVPLALGFFYNAVLTDDDPGMLEVRVAYAAPPGSDFVQRLSQRISSAVTVELIEVADEEAVRAEMTEERADLGLILGERFDERVQAGEAPPLAIVEGPDPGLGVRFVIGALEPALRDLAGQSLPATIRTDVAAPPPEEEAVFERLGFRRYSVLATILFLVVMISMLAVPVILAEEAEKRTLDALVMIASHADVVTAKALVGLTYILVSVSLQLALTGISPATPAIFIAALALLSVALIGCGLLLGSLFRNANQLNTWSGFLLMPVIAPVFLVGLPMPPTVETILTLLPTSQAMRLAINGVAGEPLFADPWLSVLVIAAWGVAAYLLLLRHLARRQA